MEMMITKKGCVQMRNAIKKEHKRFSNIYPEPKSKNEELLETTEDIIWYSQTKISKECSKPNERNDK